MPITTLSDGTALLTIIPDYCVNGSVVSNGYYLNFVSVASASSTNPFAATPAYNPVGPFNAQVANIVNYAVDSVQVDFI